MDDAQLRRVAATRPGYATYPETAPGSPSWWDRPTPCDPLSPTTLGPPRPVSFAADLVARHGQPMREELDAARTRYETALRRHRRPSVWRRLARWLGVTQ
ncbi:hypothetical protein ABT336_00340 [Micromonospora sp. NPDC000207]|uniref:hypothetical protein n=1 Tax=Micromonospora sp. NPDC000207 TaxID=3154246 RepID=UPI003328A533